jgi:hypothetical protein
MGESERILDHAKFPMARRELAKYYDSAPPAINACVNAPAEGSRLHGVKARAAVDSIFYEAYAIAVQLMASGIDHLSAVLILWHNEELPHYACFTLARGLLESSSRAVWLLDRSITENQRASRGQLERIERLWSRYRFEALDSSDARRNLDDQLDRLTARAELHGLSVDVATAGQRKGLPTKVGGERRPGPTEVIDRALQRVIGTGAGKLGVYSLLSGFVHSDSFTIGMDTIEVARQEGFTLRQSRANPDLIADLTVFAAAVHRGALDLLLEAAGSGTAATVVRVPSSSEDVDSE